jgi:Caspase domain/Trypsin-like peptidase domain/TIR domain
MNESSGVGGGGKGVRSSGGRDGWRAALAKAPREALVEELREREVLHQLAADPEGVAPARPIAAKKRTTAEQWALLAASDADLVKGVRAAQKAIYGEDGRREVTEAPAEVQALAGSVAALFHRRDVLEVEGRYRLKTRPFGQEYALAAGERFASQPCGAQGTAWVLDEHHMVTAGHCVPAGGVMELACVFGFAMDEGGAVPATFAAAQVAFPSAVLCSRELAEGGDGDWAVLRFEEALPAPPLRVRGAEVEVGEEVWMLGYPCGIPLKYAPGALVTQHKNGDRFHATLDAFAGNSGSPVFDAELEVVGILVRGGRDFAPRKHEAEPLRSMVYAETELGEEVMKLGRFVARRPSAPTVMVAPILAQASGPVAVMSGQERAVPGRRATEPGIAQALDAHALIIQISKYAAPQRALPEVHDAEDLAAALRDPALCHYPPGNVKVLADQAATHGAIVAAMRQLVAAASAESTVFFYFSGHGGQRGQTTYLLPYDCDAATAESLGRTAISSHELAMALEPLRARKVLLVFDCCHAGGMQVPASKDGGGRDGEVSEAPPVWPGLTEEVQRELLRGRGWALFASSEAGQRSYVWEGARNGIFTRHLLDGLRGGRPSDDGYVRIFELFSYVVSQVQAELPRQRPRFKCSVEENFAVARHKGGAVGVVPRTEDGFLYHALLCHARADAPFVRQELLPQLRRAGLRVATIHDVVEPGVEYVEGLERGLVQARRTLVVVSQAFLERDAKADGYADHMVIQSKARDIRSGRYSVVPIYLEDPEQLRGVPGWLDGLAGVRLGEAAASHCLQPREEMARLLTTLAGRLPTK